MDTVIVTVPVVGATGGRPREPLNLGHRTGWRGLFSPAPMIAGVVDLHPHRATAGRPYRCYPLREQFSNADTLFKKQETRPY
ncbi:MAG: hypothetical protein VR64_18775 [Desulfatitalea sp. BRH_c12]|nr:MAG: hypothetical protein VR64_18775 [Desulfatitalea sp. BRH_c12]